MTYGEASERIGKRFTKKEGVYLEFEVRGCGAFKGELTHVLVRVQAVSDMRGDPVNLDIDLNKDEAEEWFKDAEEVSP